MPKTARRTFWERLKQALEESGKPSTQVHVAKVLGIEQPSVSEWNKPGGFPEVGRAVEVARYAGVCVEWLFTERGPKRPPADDPLAHRLWAYWPRLDDATRAELVGYAAGRAPPQEGEEASHRIA